MPSLKHRDSVRPAFGSLVAAAVAATALLAVACGGGSEIAPPNPIVVGDGLGQVVLDGNAFPDTELVTAIVTDSLLQPVAVVNESVTFVTDTVQLAHRSLSGGLTVTGPGGTPTYRENDEYTVDRPTGAVTRTGTTTGDPPAPPGAIAAGATVEVSYTYNLTLLSVTTGVTVSDGEDATVIVYNLPPPTGGPLVVTSVQSAPPGDGSLAFDVRLQTELTEFGGRGNYQVIPSCSTSNDPVDCPARNELTVTSYDITNQLNPCISGSVRVTVRNLSNPDPANRSVLEITFSDPDC